MVGNFSKRMTLNYIPAPGFSSFITCYDPRTSDLTDCQDLLRSVATISLGGFIRD